MFETCHPAFYEINQLGCSNPLKNAIAFQTYMELCEVKRLWNVQYKYSEDLDLVYLEGRKSKYGLINTYVPWPAVYPISVKCIEHMQKKLKTERIIIIFREGNTESVSYCVNSGLIKPMSLEQSKALKEKQERKNELEGEIRKNASNLHEMALSVKIKTEPKQEDEKVVEQKKASE